MLCLQLARLLVCAAFAGWLAPALAVEASFPFGSELMLDAAPMRGSKRVPMLEIDENGAAAIDLWCASLRGAANVGGDTITIVPGQIGTEQCSPEGQSRNSDLLSALASVTTWRRSGDVVELIGPTTLRFRLMTN